VPMPLPKIDVHEIFPASLNQPAGGGLFYHAHWLEVLRLHYGFRFWETRDAQGGYALFAQVQGVLGEKLLSLPFSDYTFPQLEAALLPHHLAALRRHFPAAPIVLKCAGPFAGPEVLKALGKPVAEACLHRVSLCGKRPPTASFLRGVRKAQKGGLRAECSLSEDSLLQFYALYYRLRTRKLGLIPQPFSFFQQVYEQFIRRGEGFMYEVKKEEQVVASALILKEGQGLYYKWGCSAPDQLHLRPNNLLFYELMRMGTAMGCSFLDLGLSDLDETRGLIRFKRAMGGDVFPIYTWQLCPPGYPLALENKLKGMINQMAGIVVENNLAFAHTQAFSQALYPLFV
jgi:hypothetical protein